VDAHGRGAFRVFAVRSFAASSENSAEISELRRAFAKAGRTATWLM
jgi:hypothetical protein